MTRNVTVSIQSVISKIFLLREREENQKRAAHEQICFLGKFETFILESFALFFTSQNDKLPHPFNIFNIFQFYHPIKWIIKN